MCSTAGMTRVAGNAGGSERGSRRRVKRDRTQALPIISHHALRPLEACLRYLHRLPAHGNRRLHADHLLVAHLVAFMSPALEGLRHIEDVFEHRVAHQRFGLPRVPKSTLSDAQRLFDSAMLDPIIADLRQRVPTIKHDARLDELLNELVAVDGTFFAMAPRVAWALYNKPNTARQNKRRGNVRIDMHFNVLTGVPEKAIVSGGRTPEYRTLETHLESGRFYVLDRAYHCYETLAEIIKAKSDFLVRLRSDMQFEVLAEHPLSAEDHLRRVTLHQTVRVDSDRGRRELGQTPLKLIELMGDDGQPLRLLTNRVELEPELIGLTYRHRWQIELFFRWLKCVVNFRHFFSESENGVALQIGAAVIGTLLLALIIEGKPSSYDFAMMTNVMSGLLPLDAETIAIMNRRRALSARAAERQKARNAAQKTLR